MLKGTPGLSQISTRTGNLVRIFADFEILAKNDSTRVIYAKEGLWDTDRRSRKVG